MKNNVSTLLVAIAIVLLPNTVAAKALKFVKDGHVALKTELLQSILAKELCTCMYVTRPGAGYAPSQRQISENRMALCLERANLPITEGLLELITNKKIDDQDTSIEITPDLLGHFYGLFQGGKAKAKYEGEKVGCRLL